MSSYYINVAASAAIIGSQVTMDIEGTQMYLSGLMKALIDKDDYSIIKGCLENPE